MDIPTNETKTLCTICKKPISEAEFQVEEVQMTRDGPAHADCCWEECGKAIDEHPVISPRVRRG